MIEGAHTSARGQGGREAPVVALKVPGERGRRPLFGDVRTLARLWRFDTRCWTFLPRPVRAPADALADGLLGLTASCLELCGGKVVEVAAPTRLGGRAGEFAGRWAGISLTLTSKNLHTSFALS